MIVIYLNSNQSKDDYNDKLEKINHQISAYNFCEVVDVTEINPVVLIDILKLYKPYQFITYSIKEFNLSPTQLSELILTIVHKMGIVFTTLEDNLYFDKSNYLEIYPKVFKQFKNNSTVQ